MKTEIDIEKFAVSLAGSGGDDQAKLFNKFNYELKVCCKTNQAHDMQLCSISAFLDNNGIALIKELAEFVRLREENAPKTIPK